MLYPNDGEGLHRSVDPADGLHYVYGMSFMDAAPSIFACFDQPDLKAPYTFHVTRAQRLGGDRQRPGEQVDAGGVGVRGDPAAVDVLRHPGRRALPPGPRRARRHPARAAARASLARDLDADADELFTMTRQCFDEFHRLFGIRYPFGDYHQAFVPEFNAGAMENPGCVTFRDPLVFPAGSPAACASSARRPSRTRWRTSGSATSSPRSGGTTCGSTSPSPSTWATGSPPTSPSTTTPGRDNAYVRRQWGLEADQRPSTHPVRRQRRGRRARPRCRDFDGISYAKGSSILKQLATLGDDVFLAGVNDHFARAPVRQRDLHDLFASWDRGRRRRPGQLVPATGCAPPAWTRSRVERTASGSHPAPHGARTASGAACTS